MVVEERVVVEENVVSIGLLEGNIFYFIMI